MSARQGLWTSDRQEVTGELHLRDLLRTLEKRATLLRELSGLGRKVNKGTEACVWERRVACLQEKGIKKTVVFPCVLSSPRPTTG